MTYQVNQLVDVVTACMQASSHKLVPKIMYWHQRTYSFTRLGFYHPTSRGQRMIHVFDMADETHTFRLEFDAESLLWQLKYISDGEP